MMWEEISPRAREIAEKRGLQSFEKMRWHDREQLEELTGKLLPLLRSELYNAMRDNEGTAPDLSQERPAMSPAPELRRPRLVETDAAEKPKRKTFF
jgi:hypothetical protein